jgi:hypothetical protein
MMATLQSRRSVLARPGFKLLPVGGADLLASGQAAITLLVAGPICIAQMRARTAVEHDVTRALVIEEIAIAPASSPPPLEVAVGVLAVPVEKRLDHGAPPHPNCGELRIADLRIPQPFYKGIAVPIHFPVVGPGHIGSRIWTFENSVKRKPTFGEGD